jgi:hypothetical protein
MQASVFFIPGPGQCDVDELLTHVAFHPDDLKADPSHKRRKVVKTKDKSIKEVAEDMKRKEINRRKELKAKEDDKDAGKGKGDDASSDEEEKESTGEIEGASDDLLWQNQDDEVQDEGEDDGGGDEGEI